MVCPVCPSGVAVLCCPIGVYAQPFIFGDTVVIGMPPGPPLTDKNRPLKKFTGAPAGESIARTLRMLKLLFSWQATKLRQGQRCRITNSLQVHGKTLGGKKMHTRLFDLCACDLWQYSMPVIQMGCCALLRMRVERFSPVDTSASRNLGKFCFIRGVSSTATSRMMTNSCSLWLKSGVQSKMIRGFHQCNQ